LCAGRRLNRRSVLGLSRGRSQRSAAKDGQRIQLPIGPIARRTHKGYGYNGRAIEYDFIGINRTDVSIAGQKGTFFFKENGLIKKTLSLNVDGTHYQLVSYFTRLDADNDLLSRPSTSPIFENYQLSTDMQTLLDGERPSIPTAGITAKPPTLKIDTRKTSATKRPRAEAHLDTPTSALEQLSAVAALINYEATDNAIPTPETAIDALQSPRKRQRMRSPSRAVRPIKDFLISPQPIRGLISPIEALSLEDLICSDRIDDGTSIYLAH
jgi:hypothetical protein